MLLDDALPKYDVMSRHAIDIKAPRAEVWRIIRDLDIPPSPIVRGLMLLRAAPARLIGKKIQASALSRESLERGGIAFVFEEPERELVIGLVGKFWRPDSGLRPIRAEEFVPFAEKGFAKAAWNFLLTDIPGGCRVDTQTRVFCTDPASRRKFKAYWAVIGPFSGWIRNEILRSLRVRAEASRR
jgi:hypothetical protein